MNYDELVKYKNKIIKEINCVKYYFNNIPNVEDDGDIEILFCDESILSLKCSDDENIKFTDNKILVPESFFIDDDSYCSWKRIQLTNEDKWKNLVNRKIIKIEIIKDYYNNSKYWYIFGIKLHIDNENFIVFLNYGDNSRFDINNEILLMEKKDIKTIIEVL